MPMRQRLEDQLLETKCCRLAAKRVSEPSVPGEISVAGIDTITMYYYQKRTKPNTLRPHWHSWI